MCRARIRGKGYFKHACHVDPTAGHMRMDASNDAFVAMTDLGTPVHTCFNQQSMRQYLHTCLSTGTLSPFPTRRLGRENKTKTRMCNN